VAIFLVAIFFVSGADAASVVMGCCPRAARWRPPSGVVVLWGVLAGASASVLLVMGGLEGLQTASIIAAAPFLLVMVGLCASLWIALLDDIEGRRARSPEGEASALAPANPTEV
jgi:choline-glycine betaine transporter